MIFLDLNSARKLVFLSPLFFFLMTHQDVDFGRNQVHGLPSNQVCPLFVNMPPSFFMEVI